MKLNDIGPIKDKNVLFLQGPMGDFFKKLENLFREHKANTYRIGFCQGDAFFANSETYIPYRDKRKHWFKFIKQFLVEHKIDKIFLFGDCRFYQATAIFAANQLDIDVFVFEEGYFRPDLITLEKNGVNDYSALPRERSFYDNLNLKDFRIEEVYETHSSLTKRNLSAIVYYFLGNLFWFRYPYYRHHRDFSAIKEAFWGIRNYLRMHLYKMTERGMESRIKTELAHKYFFVPLQTHSDFQVLKHSRFESVESFIEEVCRSFAKFASTEDKLVFKHHPIDRGRKNYRCYIRSVARKYGFLDRVVVLHDVHLPTCLKLAKGTVTINSTVGLSSILHSTPTITLGRAVYDIEGLTNKDKDLADFWKHPQVPDKKLFKKYRYYIICKTQLNASFYGKLLTFDDHDGISGV